ncbi:MAG: hypothetical protein ACOC01_04390 [Bacteroidales bacterium]
MSFKMLIKILVILSSVFFLQGCHSEQLYIRYKVHHNNSWDEDSSRLAFFISRSAWYPATGISRFPDGGQAKHVMEKTDLFIYQPNDQSLYKIASFNDLAQIIGNHRSSWDTEVSWDKDSVLYRVCPVTEWDMYLKNAGTDEKKQEIKKLQEKYCRTYAYNLNNSRVQKVNSKKMLSDSVKTKATLTEIHDLLDSIPLLKLGYNIRELTGKTDKQLMKDYLYYRNNSSHTNRAILEQVIAEKEPEEINQMIEKVKKHLSSLKGREKIRYRGRSKTIIRELKMVASR